MLLEQSYSSIFSLSKILNLKPTNWQLGRSTKLLNPRVGTVAVAGGSSVSFSLFLSLRFPAFLLSLKDEVEYIKFDKISTAIWMLRFQNIIELNGFQAQVSSNKNMNRAMEYT
ncbi:Hypothetical_protein [Hexamita inflata]|uniref:Hypothetical_protein n=1 Tax=Hexamita inflata TaxID=28002 RepID=A0AA86URV2_9EUKA|nr:Hypothetical protein HINF_LOCUS49816 [Hexamita inflata]